MIRAVMFDLGMTLVDAQRTPFPGVAPALQAISKLKTARGRALQFSLVSDFDMPASPVTAAAIREIFSRYLEILDGTGLRPHFEPVRRRVTLSTHAGVFKPDRRVFELAAKRLRLTNLTLGQCLLVTENPQHIAAARDGLDMAALQFAPPGTAPADFSHWNDAPDLVSDVLRAGT